MPDANEPREDTGPGGAPAGAASATGGPGAQPLVAIVDDEPEVREVLARALEGAGILTASCAGPAEALRLVGTCRPDLFLLDMAMPEMTGVELCGKLRARPELERAIVVLMTGAVQGSDQGEAVVSGLDAGANDYLFKPLDLRETVARIRAWLRVKRSRDELSRSVSLAERELARSQERFRLLVQRSLDMIFVLDGDMTIRYASPSVETFLGYPPESLPGRSPLEFVHPEDIDLVRGEFEAAVRGDRDERPIEFRVRHRNGALRHLEVLARNLLDEEAVRGVVVNARDVTGRKQDEEALRHEQAYSRAILASMADGVFVIAGSGAIRSCNRRALEMLGCAEEDLLGHSIGRILAPSSAGLADESLEGIRAGLRLGRIRDLDARIARSDGTRLDVSLSCAPLSVPGAEAPEIVLVARDIGDRRQLQEEQRRQAERLAEEARRAREYADAVLRISDPQARLIGKGPAHGRIVDFVRDAAGAPSPVLVLGESGTGKEVVARAIRLSGPRADKPFVVVDCSTLAASLLESELFGHEKGAFTGAAETRAGLMEVADGGTLFVDEIGEMPLELQPKLLRVLERGEYRRLGSTEPRRVDIRVIAATNRDLAREVKAKRFRQDLFYRLNVLTVTLPPLRERREDIPVLAQHFLEHGMVTVPVPKSFRRETLDCLEAYDWPDNVRELANVVERAVILSKGQAEIAPRHLPPEVRSSAKPAAGCAPAQVRSLADVEKEAIALALEAAGWNKTRAAGKLGIARVTLREKIAQYGLADKRPGDARKPD